MFYVFNLTSSYYWTECFQAGECKDSFYITGAQKSDEFQCLDFCKSGSFCWNDLKCGF